MLGFVVSGSMQPTISDRAFVVGNRLAYTFSKPKRGDIVLIEYEQSGKDTLGKRIVGMPGDEISFSNGRVYINGNLLEEKYLDVEVRTECTQVFEVPKDFYFVMGDNRENSEDSRYWEQPYVDKTRIAAKVICYINW